MIVRGLLAAAAVALLVGCGSSTAPKGNPNPNPQRRNITLTGGAFTPTPDTVLIGDSLFWIIGTDETGHHQISFTSFPAGADPKSVTPSRVMAPGDTTFTAFLKAGTYMYKDDSSSAAGTVVVNPLP